MNTRVFRSFLTLFCAFVLLIGCVSTDSGTLKYAGPMEISIPAGQALPGTSIIFVRETPDGAELRINDQRAVKKTGDFVGWKGNLGRDFDADLGLRVVFYSAERLQLAGTANLEVRNPNPAVRTFPEKPAISFRVPVTYSVKKDERIPGTTIFYTGSDANGANFGGLPPGEFPSRQTADSLVWTGRLADGALLRLDLRVVLFSGNMVQLAGIATLAAG